MEIPVLSDLVVILGISIVVLFVCSSIRIPAVIGYLLTGMIVGPYGLGGVSDIYTVQILAQIGLTLLLFTIGIEFSIVQLLRQKFVLLIGGGLQTGLTLLFILFLLTKLGYASNLALFIGFVVPLSCTAVIFKILQERGEFESPVGRHTLSLLIFQDLITIPMLLITPLLTGESENLTQSLLLMTAKGILLIASAFLISKYIFPNLLYQVIRLRNRDLFLSTIIVTGCGIAYAASLLDLSLGLGAFLAGLIISESEYSHQALDGIIPFRDIFMSFFFVSTGMLLDVQTMIAMFPIVAGLSVLTVVVKASFAILALALVGLPLKTAIITGLVISQIGEFSFVLIELGRQNQIISEGVYQLCLSVSVCTIMLTPVVISFSGAIANAVLWLPFPVKLRNGYRTDKQWMAVAEHTKLENHLVIIGFGINGRNLAQAAKTVGIPYVICEMNPETVVIEREKGEPIFYGDATQEPVLNHTHIKKARVLVIAIGDASATRRITEIAHHINPNLYIIARTRFIGEVEPLHKLGADEVIPEEYETAVAIFHRLLKKYLIPDEQIQDLLNNIRSDDYGWFRDRKVKANTMKDLELHLPDMEISTICIHNNTAFVNKSILELNIRQRFGLSILAVRRGGEFIANPKSDCTLQADDMLVVLGNQLQTAELTKQVLEQVSPSEMNGQGI